MNTDPVSPQGRHTVTIGDVALTIDTPPDLDSLLDRAAAETPQAVDAIPYYAILWPAARGLADHLWRHRAGLSDRRLIELGCGLGLPSILAARLGARVTSTDFHPDTGTWLLRNAALNGIALDYAQLDWNAFLERRPEPGDAQAPTVDQSLPFSDLRSQPSGFHLVVGSDLIYERRHIPALVCAIDALCAADGHAVISDPGRDPLALFVSTMEKSGWRLTLETEGDIYICRFDRQTTPTVSAQQQSPAVSR